MPGPVLSIRNMAMNKIHYSQGTFFEQDTDIHICSIKPSRLILAVGTGVTIPVYPCPLPAL